MPIVNIFGPLIGIVFAGVVFGEIPHHSPIDLALELVGLVAVAAGLRGLARAETDRPAEMASAR